MLDFFKQLLNLLNVRYTTAWLNRQIEDTPYINTMLGISAILWKYNIENKAIHLTNKNDIRSVSLPCIVLYKQEFVIVKSIREKCMQITHADGSEVMIDINAFYKDWNGAIILLNVTTESQEPQYSYHHKLRIFNRIKQATIWGYIALLCCLGIFFNQANNEWFWWALLFINFIGIGITYMLLQKDMHIPNILADKICSLVKNANCDNVTQVKAASLWGFLKLSEIGASFFFVNFITIIFFHNEIPTLTIIALGVLPFSFWSIWYQKYKIKQWCVLCLVTLFLMWAQAIVLVIATTIESNFSIFIIKAIKIVTGYIFVALLINKWVKIRESLRSERYCRTEYNNLKFQEEVVSAIEGNANYFKTDADNCTSLLFGDANAPYCLTVFSNPFCAPCAFLHHQIKDYINRNVSIKYVFSYFTEELSDINKLFIASYQQLGPEMTWELMNQWYDGGKERGLHFFKDLGLNIETKDVAAEFSKHNKWKDDVRLHGTPTVLINGREIIFPYNVNDYMFLPK